jgi:hypothetical protein
MQMMNKSMGQYPGIPMPSQSTSPQPATNPQLGQQQMQTAQLLMQLLGLGGLAGGTKGKQANKNGGFSFNSGKVGMSVDPGQMMSAVGAIKGLLSKQNVPMPSQEQTNNLNAFRIF